MQDPELYSRLGNIEAKVDIILSWEKRLRRVEQFEARITALAAGVSAIIAFIVKLI